jgi:ribonuclease P protein component
VNIFNAEENLSTKQPSPGEETRVSVTHGDQERESRDSSPPSERAQTPDSASLLEIDFGLPKEDRLKKPAEFRHIYSNGKRFDGRFMSAFILPNKLQNHRLGITASRKGVGKSVFRNRAKRLLREAFRLSKIELNALQERYDFVLNARRNLLKVKMQAPLADFRQIIERIRVDEKRRGEQLAANINLTAE